jgi:hypothetical protein
MNDRSFRATGQPGPAKPPKFPFPAGEPATDPAEADTAGTLGGAEAITRYPNPPDIGRPSSLGRHFCAPTGRRKGFANEAVLSCWPLTQLQ